MTEIDIRQLKLAVADIISREQGQITNAMAIVGHLPMLPAETSQEIVSFVVGLRSGMFDDPETGEPDELAVRAFTEGILCGLRIRTAIARLADTPGRGASG